MKMNKEVEELVKAPLLIAAIKDAEILNKLNNLIPYSTGFEIEGNYSKLYNGANFTSIPYIMDVDNSYSEQRFRIPNGIRGIICLYLIARQLRVNCELNMESGIHYHVDCTDVDFNVVKTVASNNATYILNELDSWGYRRSYNSRGLGYAGNWLKFNDLSTFEYRIGEMTFDYDILLKRIIHVNEITRYVKKKINGYQEPTYDVVDFKSIFTHLKLPYTLGAYTKDNYTAKIGEVRKQIADLDKKPPEQELNIRKRRHIV